MNNIVRMKNSELTELTHRSIVKYLVILGGVSIFSILRPLGGRLMGEEGGVGILFSFSFDVEDV